MLSLYGRDQAIRNVCCLARIERPLETFGTLGELRAGYLDFLDHHQRGTTTNREEGFLVDDHQLEEKLASAFTEGALNDLNQADVLGAPFDAENHRAKSELARQALSAVLELDDDFASVFSLVIHSIFVRPSKPAPGIRGSHGGSSSASIGAIWLTVADSIQLLDIMEMYVHEMCHHLLFIDELNHPQFNYAEIAKRENFARSAILRISRPLDKVIHSIVVAAELLESRRRFLNNSGRTLIHPPSPELAANGLTAVSSVRELPNLPDLITPHLAEVVAHCHEVFLSNEG